MKTRILIVLMTFVFAFTNTLQSQKLSQKKVQITGLKNANYLKTDAKGNVIAGSEMLGGSTNALIKGDNTVTDINLKIHGNKKLDVKFSSSVIKGYNQVKLQSNNKIILDSKSIEIASYPTKTGVVKPLVDLTDNQFITKSHLAGNISNSPEIVGGDNIIIDKSDPKRWVINYSAVPIDNEAPVITIDRDYESLPRGTTEFTANISFSDANGDALTKTWTQTSRNFDSSVVIDNENNTFSNLRDDKYYSFKCIVTDVWDASSEINLSIRIKGDMNHYLMRDIQNEIRYDINYGEPNEEIMVKFINTFDFPIELLDEGVFIESGDEYITNITLNLDGSNGINFRTYDYVDPGVVIGELSILSRSSGLALPQDNPLELSFL